MTRTATGTPPSVVCAAMPAADASRVAAALLAAPPGPGGTRVLAIDGPSGSGKTTLAGRVAAELDAPVFHLEDVYPGWDGLEATVPRVVDWVLRPVAEGRPARYRRYDWAAGGYAEWHDVPAGPVLIVEGVASGALACAPYLSLLVWVEAPDPVRYGRAMARDGDTYRPHWDRWDAQAAAHFAAQRTAERADLRLNG